MTPFEQTFKNYFMKVAKDIIDNYEKYTLKERITIFKLLKEMVIVNKPLKSYDCKDVVVLTPKESEEEEEKHDKYLR